MFSFFTQKKKRANNKTQKNFKKMNCSPLFAGRRVNKETCYSNKILFKIRDEYNKSSSNPNKIESNNPNEIWKQLRDNLVDCKVESCWLREIKDKELSKKIKEYVFAPEQPPEWEKNPNEWLSNYDLLEVMSQYETTYPDFAFLGPSCIDFDTKLPEKNGKCVEEEICHFSLKEYLVKKKYRIGIIFNLDKHDQSGSHWVSLYIDIKHQFIFFFDSAGNAIPKEINILCDRIIEQGKELTRPVYFKFIQNYPKTHQYSNTECGMYSLFFIITFLIGKIGPSKKKDHKTIIHFFKHKRIPDSYVEQYRNVYFNNTE
jgi:hypothetical protein